MVIYKPQVKKYLRKNMFLWGRDQNKIKAMSSRGYKAPPTCGLLKAMNNNTPSLAWKSIQRILQRSETLERHTNAFQRTALERA